MDQSGDEEGRDDDIQSQPNVPSWRACDNCRNRKIKCDKRSPCSNCRATGTVCRTANRPKDQRQRILISNQYEKKVELIESRLARIEGLLQNLAVHSASIPLRAPVKLSPLYSPQPDVTSSLAGPSSHTESSVKTSTAFEGDSSLRAHSVHASRVFEHAMHNDALVGHSPEMQDALSALRNLIEKQHALSTNHDWGFPNHQADASLDITSLKMPDMTSVVSLLRLCKEAHNFLDIPFLDFDQVNELCKKVYFVTEDYSLGAFTLVNGGLYYLFGSASMAQGKEIPEFQQNAAICRTNLEYALGKFTIFTAPTFENMQALLLGASYAIDISQPSLCWALTSTAARFCQTLGYHRSVVSPDDSKLNIQLKKRMFWFTYILDKSLALRLGHSSILQDFDITLDLPDVSPDTRLSMWDVMYHHWVKVGRFQGRVYEELYSPQALSGSVIDRTQRAQSIVSDMKMWYKEIMQIDPSQAYNPSYYAAATLSCEIMYYSLLTLAYRSIPPDPTDSSKIFSTDCIETARSALEAHHRNSERYKDSNSYIWQGYISWILMNVPFTPFMVIFCHAIATANLSDLKCLEDFVRSLQSTGELVEAAEKLWRLCHVFHRVAKLYIDAKLKQQQQNFVNQQMCSTSSTLALGAAESQAQNPYQGPGSGPGPAVPYPMDDFSTYLSALGFPNAATGGFNVNVDPMATDYIDQEQQGTFTGDSVSLGNWFAGNVNIMSLLEMDLSNINPGNM